jgi:prepilin-type N-terminal cleavage/methylation domain-containing protein
MLILKKELPVRNTMKTLRTGHQGKLQGGFTLVELTVTLAIILIVAGIAIPNMMQAWADMELRSVASQVADLMQQARMRAAKNNATYPIRYQVTNGVQQVYIDLNNNSAWDNAAPNPEPIIDLPRSIALTASAPNGNTGATPYVFTADTTSGTPYTNTDILAFSPRGLPCNYDSPPACTTPTASYFVYYFQDSRPNSWAAVLVTKAGRTKVLTWNGSSWN